MNLRLHSHLLTVQYGKVARVTGSGAIVHKTKAGKITMLVGVVGAILCV